MHLIDFDIETFRRDYWQKKPLLIRNPWDAWKNPLDPDDLAGLACEKEVESRLIRHKHDKFKIEHGPFKTKRFAKLGKKPWTLLVQAVDHAVPEVAALIEPFRFVPNWRIDDVMVSYATDGGGVGPHFDQYDVFLIQGLGRRRWQVGGLCDAATNLMPHDDLRLLADFVATDEWVLEPGDILYVPPRIAHNGIAVGDDCMTYSIGFRAPSRSELIAHWCDHLLAEMSDDDRYADPDLPAQPNPGEIRPQALVQLHDMVAAKMLDRAAFARWFGQYTSTPKYPEIDWAPDAPVTVETVRQAVRDGVALRRNPASRFAFIGRKAGALTLFVDGEEFDCVGKAAILAEAICAKERVELGKGLLKSGAALALVAKLAGRGSLTFNREDIVAVAVRTFAVLMIMLSAWPAGAQSADHDKTVVDIAKSPLEDVNVLKKKIPPVLERAADAPYSTAGLTNCPRIAAAVKDLDAALGRDVDAPTRKGKPNLATELAMDAGQDTINSLIPGRFIIRRVTGAYDANKRALAAVYAGSVRRGFLKGLGMARGCKPPAAPISR